MGVWGPYNQVWVNGDPVGLISRDMMREFEQPYTSKLFTSTGGGHFHNHTLGIFQVDQVAQTKGIMLQEFTKDFNCQSIEDALINDIEKREKIISASRITPIYAVDIDIKLLDKLLPIIKDGRFIIQTCCDSEEDKAEIIKKVRQFSNYK